LLAQTNLGVGEGAQLLHGCCIGQWLEQTLGSIQQILVFFAVGRGLVCRRGFGGRLAGGAEREGQQAGSGQQADVKRGFMGGFLLSVVGLETWRTVPAGRPTIGTRAWISLC